MRTRAARVAVIAVVGGSALGRAQERPVVWTAAPTATRPVAPGDAVTVRLTATFDQGWHVYSITQGAGGPIPTRIAVVPGQAFYLVDAVRGPKPTTRFDPNFGINVETYDEQATFTLRVRVAPTAKVGQDTVAITAHYQACTASLCLPPHTERILMPLTVARGARAATALRPVAPPSERPAG